MDGDGDDGPRGERGGRALMAGRQRKSAADGRYRANPPSSRAGHEPRKTADWQAHAGWRLKTGTNHDDPKQKCYVETRASAHRLHDDAPRLSEPPALAVRNYRYEF